MPSQNKEFSKLYNGLYRLLLGFVLLAHPTQRYLDWIKDPSACRVHYFCELWVIECGHPI